MNSVDITLDNFQSVFIEGSKDKLVMIDFWADWCEPCKNLMPILEKLASEYQQHLVLAKVNCDEQQQIAAQFQIRSLPTVMLVKDGQPIDGFAGVKTEGEIKAMIDKHLPSPEESLLNEAIPLYQAQDFNAALPLLKQALEAAPQRHDIQLLLADTLVELKQVPQAKAMIEGIPLVAQDQNYQSVVAKITLAEEAAQSPEIVALEAQYQAEPTNKDVAIELAIQYHQAGRSEESLALLYSVLSQDLHYGDARKHYLDILASLPDGEAFAPTYRRKIYGLLY